MLDEGGGTRKTRVFDFFSLSFVRALARDYLELS